MAIRPMRVGRMTGIMRALIRTEKTEMHEPPSGALDYVGCLFGGVFSIFAAYSSPSEARR
jgi:hypothetical protein